MTDRARRPEKAGPVLLALELALVLYWSLLPMVLLALHAQSMCPPGLPCVQEILLLLNALAGFLVGAQFPVANLLWLSGRNTLGSSAGTLYACDLVGAFLGSVVVSVALLPVMGIVNLCLLAATLKLGTTLGVAILVLRG